MPAILLLVVKLILFFYLANKRTCFINRAQLCLHLIVTTNAVTTIEKLRFTGAIDVATTSAALVTGKRGR